MAKVTVTLSSSLTARVTASGKTIAELVEMGLAIAEAQAGAPDLTAAASGPVSAQDCKHPPARRDRKSGLCNACGTNVGTGGKS